jgi:phosphinothricin acetyltransferase
MIRPVTIADAPAICEIYNYYIKHTVITFEEDLLTPAIMEGRVREITPSYPWFVWDEAGEIWGYAYIHRWHERTAYRYSAEDSLYLREGCQGRGLGGKLLGHLLGAAKSAGIHTVIGGITLPNERSVAVHEKFGFKKIAHFSEVGYKFETWLDVGYWELAL